MPPPRPPHHLHRRPHTINRPHQIRLKNILKLLVRRLQHRHIQTVPRIRKHHIQPPEYLHRTPHQLLNLPLLPYITPDRQRTPPHPLNLPRQGLQPFQPPCRHHHVHPRPRTHPRRGRSNPRAGPRNHNHTLPQINPHVPQFTGQPAPSASPDPSPPPGPIRVILLAMDDAQLIQRICQTALLRGHFVLRSGRTSSYYLDKYLFETQPDILAALTQRLAQRLPPQVDRLAGAELGAVPLVTALSLHTGKPAVFIRNRKKDYGTEKLIEGRLEKGDRVLLVEDIVTTGGQTLEAARTLREAGATIVKILAVIDRQEGGRQNIESAGFLFESLFTRSDLGITD